MKSNKIISNFYSSYNKIVTLVFSLIAFIKFMCIYERINLGEFSPIYATITLGIINGSYFIFKKFSNKFANVTTTVFYIVVSTILFVDSVYFSYMNKFTSFTNIKMLSFLKDVSSSVKEVNPIGFLWIFADIPIILIYMFLIHKKLYIYITKRINLDINISKLKIIERATSIAILLIITIYSNTVNFKLKYIKNENIIYHIKDIVEVFSNFDKEIDYMEYFKVKEVQKDENYGIAKNKNIIIIQVEALQNFVVNREYNETPITPFLNSLIDENTFYFNNYFSQVGGGNTSDAEFTVNNSLISTPTDSVYMNYMNNNYYSLPYILKDNGYNEANAYHAYKREFWNREIAYINQGFDNYYSSGDYEIDEVVGLGLSDESFLKQVANKISEAKKPFYSFIITLSSHHPYYLPEGYGDIEIKEEHKGTLFGDYINSISYVDSALEGFFKELKEKNLYDDSIFIIYGDHFGIANYDHPDAEYVSQMLGYKYEYKDMMNVPLIIHIPCMEKKETIKTVTGHVDVLPTLLHLLGIENNKAIMAGNDIFSVEDNIVYEMAHVGNGSFITNEIFYYSSITDIDAYNMAYDMQTGETIKITPEMLQKREKAIEFLENSKGLLEENEILLK